MIKKLIELIEYTEIKGKEKDGLKNKDNRRFS